VSLSQAPAFSELRDNFVCGYKDISHARYAGASGKHMPDGNAVDTTNGAGPHNIQMFILSADGTVLTCLPGYWHSEDLGTELNFAKQLNLIWTNPDLTREEKDEAFRQAQLSHIVVHSKAMRNRSRMQSFDEQFEVQKRYWATDTIANRNLITPKGRPLSGAMKTTDRIMHERMAMRPFEKYEDFDVAAFSDYGKQKYDKREDFLDPTTGTIAQGADPSQEKMIGNDPKAHPIQTEGKKLLRRNMRSMLRYGLRAALR
jgi:hypothetical protein